MAPSVEVEYICKHKSFFLHFKDLITDLYPYKNVAIALKKLSTGSSNKCIAADLPCLSYMNETWLS